jgi:6-phosphogluconolactonase
MTGAPSGDAWVEAAGTHIAEVVRRAAAEAHDGVARMALSGGNTPRPVYEWLASRGGVAWDRVEIYFGDERAVPPDHPESNYRMVMESLVAPAGIDPTHVFRMEADRQNLAAAAADYARVLPDPLPVLLLGIGKDGHTASLFPGGSALTETELRVAEVPADGTRLARLTVTPPVLASARRVIVLARGEAKAAPVARALQGPWEPHSCPAQLARQGVWLLDAAASADIEGNVAPG